MIAKQVTWLHFLSFEDPLSWENPQWGDKHPFRRQRHLCDIVHVPLKTGEETLKVIEKASVALRRYEG